MTGVADAGGSLSPEASCQMPMTTKVTIATITDVKNVLTAISCPVMLTLS